MTTANDILKREQAKAKRDHLVLTLLRDMKAMKLPAPVREWKFHPSRKWRFDLAWPVITTGKVAVEVEGGQWVKSRHRTGKGFAADMDKYNAGVLLGWRILRFTTSHIENGEAVPVISEALGHRLEE